MSSSSGEDDDEGQALDNFIDMKSHSDIPDKDRAGVENIGEADVSEAVELSKLTQVKAKFEGGETQYYDDEEDVDVDGEAPDNVPEKKLSMTKRKKMNHVWRKNIRCYEELEPEFDKVEQEMKDWVAQLDAESISELNEKEESFFWALTKERDPDVWPRTPDPPFPFYIEQTHVYQEIVDEPLPFEYDETFDRYKTVKLYVNVKEMGLDDFEQGVLKELVAARYDESKDMLKLVCRNYPSREQNLNGVKQLTWEVFNEVKELAKELQSKPEYYAAEVEKPKPPYERKQQKPKPPRPILRETRFRRAA
eukprot:CAMPEP_0184488298 /NCGR_PEP_ID=MMETSP0113_2-20130426/11110_1 /TAXON_ID=91329 /ORGANISM="Norrisiella sphaerica, Strain BC52" /LENGTH=306 /DNA_ID=CAMNT_0026870891 /DNA_START=117 /DNA_END=1037 /DNA_ORIENTATION=+